ncbi:MAG: aminotransferase class IV [Candidatus Sumerlaeia bacterium]|nr:aminotransferase class IV [Candidatus Sumerlaeia bacterium]
METVWLNGKYMPLSEGNVSLEDRGLLFADGVYEVIAAYNGVPFILDEHLERMIRSADGIRLESPHTTDVRRQVIHDLVTRLGVSRAMIYGQLTRGSSRRSHPLPKAPTPTEYWFARELPPVVTKNYREGVHLITQPEERWARCWIKSTSLLPNVLAKQAALDVGAFDSLYVLEDGVITETSAANCYIVRDGNIFTHPANGRILGGCKRALVMELARRAGIGVHEEFIPLDQAREAEEMFITSTTLNVLPVTTLDDNPISNGRVGPITGRLMEAVGDAIREKCGEIVMA